MSNMGWSDAAIRAMETVWSDTSVGLPGGISEAKAKAQTADDKAVAADNKAVVADNKAVVADDKAVKATNQIQVEKPTSLTPTINIQDNFKLTVSLKPTNPTLTSCSFILPANGGVGHTISITTKSAITSTSFSPSVTGGPTTMTANSSFKFTWDGDEWITIL